MAHLRRASTVAVVCVIYLTFAKSAWGIPIKDLLPPLDTVNDVTQEDGGSQGHVNDTDIHNVISSMSTGSFDMIDWHIACRSCKELVINGRYSLLTEKNEIVEYFTDRCHDDFSEQDQRRDCDLVIQTDADVIFKTILDALDPMYVCKQIIHICPAKLGVSKNEV